MTLATKMKFGVVIFPGSNCDTDAWHALNGQMGAPVEYIWHQETDLSGFDCVILPGGFSYGDYLRTGAIARFSPVMNAVTEFAGKGGLVIGICNGFQILLEAGLLPGAMMRNVGQTFVCKYVNIRVESTNTPYTRAMQEGAGLRLRSASPHPERPSGPRPGPSGSQRGSRGAVLRIPIAHGEGNYYADAGTLAALKRHDQIIFRYCTSEGEITKAANPNGSLRNIAGICNRERNVMGMMPHPERCSDPLLGSSDGRLVWESLLAR
jgi:phosphoribosylformylglycinamidine synthase